MSASEPAMCYRTCTYTRKRIRPDGSTYECETTQMYKTKGIIPQISEETKQKIIELYNVGVAVAKISRIVGVSVYRINGILKHLKNKSEVT